MFQHSMFVKKTNKKTTTTNKTNKKTSIGSLFYNKPACTKSSQDIILYSILSVYPKTKINSTLYIYSVVYQAHCNTP